MNIDKSGRKALFRICGLLALQATQANAANLNIPCDQSFAFKYPTAVTFTTTIPGSGTFSQSYVPGTPQYNSLLASSSTSTSNSFSSSSQQPTHVVDCTDTQSIIQDQQSRAIVRQISSQISDRIGGNVNREYYAFAGGGVQAASADRSSLAPNSAWTGFAWSRLNNNGNVYGTWKNDIFQSTTGADWNVGNLYLGTTLDYAGATNQLNTFGADGSTQTVGMTPYLAYAFNKNFFLSALSGYHYMATTYRSFALPSSHTDSFQGELALNGLHVVNGWFMKGKAGARYLHTKTHYDAWSTTTALDPSNPAFGTLTTTTSPVGYSRDSWTILASAELGYAFNNGLRAYNGILFEHVNAPNFSNMTGLTYGIGNNIFYYNVGADYPVTKNFTLGTKLQTDLNNSNVNMTTLSLNARLVLD